MQAHPTVDIIPGFAEGSWHTNILLRELEKYGYRKAANSAEADVIITHSAGCFFLPNSVENKQIIMIGPPYWPGRPMIVSASRKVWGDFSTAWQRGKLGFWGRKLAWNYVYVGANILRVFRIARFASRQNLHEALRDKKVAIIRNDDDAWFSPDAEQLLPASETYSHYKLPGEHEDCWVFPEEHAKLIDEIIRKNRIGTESI
ncbi:MAG TPA: hypothetical protein VF572_05075 [Candidatus Saccharimonadales bacterium]|jgi:hypothetical protein